MQTLTAKPKTILGQSDRVIITPDKYNQLSFIQKNRGIKSAHVKIMKESVLRNGVLRLVIVVWSEDQQKYLIVDGQHLTRALQNLNRNIECTVVDVEDENHLTQLMIDLNNVSKSWNANDYIHGWAESGNKHYKTLRFELSKSDLQLSVVLMAYTQKRRCVATKMMKEGSFEIVDKKEGDKLISQIKDCNNFVASTRAMNEALVQIMITIGNYNHAQMIKNLEQAVKFGVQFSKKEGEMFNQLVHIYKNK
jgi:hypothetical protein